MSEIRWEACALKGSAKELHEFRPESGSPRHIYFMDVVRPALVLGSSQRRILESTDLDAKSPFEVCVRDSGGGAVLLEPESQLWVGVYVRPDDPLVQLEISKSFDWLADASLAALGQLGIDIAQKFDGVPVWTPLSRALCFGGISHGELSIEGRKMVGISQRRSKDWVIFHLAVLIRDHQQDVLELLAAHYQLPFPVPRTSIGLSELVPDSGDLYERIQSAVHSAFTSTSPVPRGTVEVG